MTEHSRPPAARRAAVVPSPAAVAVAAALLAAALSGCQAETDDAQEPPPRPIAWTEVETAGATELRTLVGTVRTAQRAPLSFEVSGRVAEVDVEIGDRFAAGAVLARLDTRTYELGLQERRSSLAEAEAQLEEARGTFERQSELYGEGWVSRAAYDNAKAALDSARSRVETARTRVEQAREDLADTVLEAPYDGTVASRDVEPSQRVAAGETVLAIQGLAGGFEVVVSAPETLVDRLTRGSRHAVRFPARPGLSMEGTVTEIASDAEARNAYPVTVALAAVPPDLRSGLTAEVAFELGQAGAGAGAGADAGAAATVIPVTAFVAAADDTAAAFVYDADSGTVERRIVEIASIADGTVEVASGLEPGEIVATRGVAFLRDGQRVTLMGEGVARYSP